VPLKQKTGKEVTAAFKSVLFESGKKPKLCQSDSGKEFYNTIFQNLMNSMNIKHYSTFSVMKASICERFNRTLKTMMYKEFSMQGNHKWLTLLPKLLKFYNGKYHQIIQMKPIDVSKLNEKKIFQDVYTIKPPNKINIKLKVGDIVRVSKHKSLFAKGYI
jgi:hypothetical protein